MLRRPKILVALLSTFLLLGACGNPPISDDSVAKSLNGVHHVQSAKADCTSSFPFKHECNVAVVLGDQASVEDIKNAIQAEEPMLSSANVATVSVGHPVGDATTTPFSFTFTSVVADPEGCAKALRYALKSEVVNGLSINLDDDHSVNVGIDAAEGDVVAIADAAKKIARLTQSNSLDARNDAFDIGIGDDRIPTEEVELLKNVATRFNVVGGSVNKGALVIRLSASEDLAAAQAFVKKEPQYGSIAIIDLVNDKELAVRGVGSAFTDKLARVNQTLSEQPVTTEVKTFETGLNIGVNSVKDARIIDKHLNASVKDDYDAIDVNYLVSDEHTIGRTAGGTIDFSLMEDIEAVKDLDQVKIDILQAPNQAFASIKVESDATMYATGKALASAGLATVDADITLHAGKNFETTFTVAPHIAINSGAKMPANQALRLEHGWSLGQEVRSEQPQNEQPQK